MQARLLCAALVALATPQAHSQSSALAEPWQQPNSIASTTWVGTKQMAVILIDFQNQAYPLTPAQAYQRVFVTGQGNDPGPIVDYWYDASYGLLDVAGAVIGPVQIPYDYNPPVGTCSPDLREAWAAAALAEAESTLGFVPQNYDLILYAGESTCNAVGLPNANPPGAYVDNLSLFALAHELGHGLGLYHADGLTCSGGLNFAACQVTPYGDEFDVMGDNIPFAGTYNQVKRGQLGWIDPATISTIENTGPSGMVRDLYPIESFATKIKTVRVPRVVNVNGNVEQYYYVEFRQPTLWDTFSTNDPVANGTLIRLAHHYEGGERSYLIDSTPAPVGETPDFYDAPFVPSGGQPAVFTDSVTGTTIETLSVTKTGNIDTSAATVKVITGQVLTCTYGDPIATVNYPNGGPIQTVRLGQGQSVVVDIQLTNQDSVHCMWSALTGDFEIDGVPAKEAWGPEVLASFDLGVPGATSFTFSRTITVPPGTTTGPHPVSLEVNNLYTGYTTTTNFMVVVQ